ncbi:hypothetical protein TVAG_159910 [Trichomonas vaginalis G3]|uniref:Uncharacterized protein n=1 Tax=Trichomonas vaginalis (strain ATCC PRA-98 / G3) TaxID=412133 RepID=A2DUT3_TRIV3|nr:hypothetical protein TVAGG3_0259500 [Trichomonas vaginalis G3]EAY15818.1 hypothetical protein TVAG_159910 [Trichomonas vaginalis G3]KAI5525011.1 hypothetical protein TVAGG3_0259500 [Trichomonas vaginalis G3]|eukprot:XP_001328041.1 hypothetical protein [Trichomonas vaginalis G3]
MSESPKQTANNIFAEAISKLMAEDTNKSCIGNLAQISQLLVKIDSQVPGAAEALLSAILTNFRQAYN